MHSSKALSEPVTGEVAPPAAILRGTARGLEVVVDARAPADAIAAAVQKRLDEAPGFFRGSDVRVRVEDGPLPSGCLARLDDLATRFALRIVEVSAVRALTDSDAVPKSANLAAGSAPAATQFDEEGPTQSAALIALPEAIEPSPHAEPITLATCDLTELIELLEEPMTFDEPTQTAVPLALAVTAEVELEPPSTGTRLLVGPVRSGVILEHAGHLIVFGDVNPGAEIRAEGNIVVLGRLRGMAHAGIGQDVGFVLALRLEPQQLRIGRMVARAADSDLPAAEAEIAYGQGDAIVVERYQGRLPRNLATSI